MGERETKGENEKGREGESERVSGSDSVRDEYLFRPIL